MFRRKKQIISPEEYLVIEEAAEFKSEYWDGFVEKRADSDIIHIQVVTNLTTLLFEQLRKRNCRVFATDLKVWIEKQKLFLYPDVVAICDEIKFYQERRDVIVNPILIVEYSSFNTRNTDRTEKFWAYQEIESLKEYVLITETGGSRDVVEHYVRQDNRSWKYTMDFHDKEFIYFESVDVRLPSNEVFRLNL